MNNKKILQNKTIISSILIFIGIILIIIGIFLSISYGAQKMTFEEIIKNILNNDSTNINAQIIRTIRIPRVLCALFIGAFLAIAGAIMQGITQNPIASPSIMGITQGSALAVAIFMATQPVSSNLSKIGFAFIGATISGILIFFLSLNKNKLNITKMILAGTALGMLFISLASMIALLSNNSKNLAFFLAGGLSGATWEQVKILAILALISISFAIGLSKNITILSLGDQVAIGFGTNPNKIRILSLIIIILLTGASVAVAGNIGFVCLIIPHITKLCIGSDYRYIIPIAGIFGAILVIYSDILARVLISPYEIPLGTITSLIGVIVLVYLIRKENINAK